MKYPTTAGVAVLLTLLAAPASRAEVSFRGFGQVIGGSTLDKDKPMPGFAYDGDLAFEPESLFALQATAPLAPQIDAVAQIVARGSEDFEPEFAWAYVRYQLSDRYTLKAGRQRIAYYRYSEYLEVGAAYPFLRPPLSVYDLPFNNGDGVSLSANYSAGPWSFQPQLQYIVIDQNSLTDEGPIHVRLPNQAGVVLEATYDDWLSLRASHFRSDVTVEVQAAQPLFDGLAASGDADTANELSADDDSGQFSSVAFDINRHGLLLGGELIHYEVDDSYVGPTDGFYVSAGYRWNKLTPIVTWGRYRSGATDEALSTIDPGSPLYPAVVGFIASTQRDDNFASLGLRYDLRDNVALKLDYTRRRSKIDDTVDANLLAGGLVFSF